MLEQARVQKCLCHNYCYYIGDNIAQNMIEGFTRTLNANGFCRTCTMYRNEWLYAIRENANLLRSEENYTQGQHGIRQISLFNELR